jgi:DNA-binding winged helix-turn-helix (wHTH) protein
MSQAGERILGPAAGPVERGGTEPGLLRVGVFEIDQGGGSLRKAGVLVKLRQQPFLVLCFLAARPGRVVTREELRARVWGGDTFVDFDQGLNYCIKEIRAALGDSAETPLYVETLPRRGYRFIAPVEALGDALPRERGPDQAQAAGAPAPTSLRRWVKRGHLALTAAAVATAAWLALRPAPEPPEWRRVSFRRGSVSGARFGPGDGMVYAAAWDGGPATIFAATPGAPDARGLPFTDARVVSVSASGELSFIETRPDAQPVLSQAPLAGGPAKQILEGVLDADATGDGRTFAVAHLVAGRGLRIEYPIGRVVAPANNPTGLRISPDGERLAFLEHPWTGDDRGQVVVLRADGTPLTRSGLYPSVDGLAWSARGDRVYFTASRTGASSALRSLDLDGRERTVLPASGRLVIHDVRRDGSLLLERCLTRGGVALLGPEGGERDLSWFDASVGSALSADGSRLLLSESGDAGGPGYAAYLRATDGSPPLRLGGGSATGLSPDGRVALAIPLEAPDHIDMLPTGPGEVRALRHAGIVQYQWAAFTPDGQGIVFVGGERHRNMRVFLGDLAGGPPRGITPEGLIVSHDTVSPDGRSLYGPCRPLSFCIYPLDGGAPRRVEGLGGFLPVGWDPSGRSLIVRPRGGGVPLRLERLDLETGQRSPWRQVAPGDPVGVRLVNVLVGRDGRTLVLNYVRRLSELYVVPALD